MPTKAIDKLRIQGNAAPRRGPDTKRSFHHPAFHDPDAASHFIFQGETGSIANGSDVTAIANSHPSSAASRRHDHLQRVQQANRGLTSVDIKSLGHEGLPNIHFLLRGKPINGEMDSTDTDATKTHQRVGHFKTSVKEAYRARHRVLPDASPSEEHRNYFRANRNPFHELDSNSAGVSPASYFYLGPSVSGKSAPYVIPGQRNPSEFTSSAPAILNRNQQNDLQLSSSNADIGVWPDVISGTETEKEVHLTTTPRGSPQYEEYTDFGDSLKQMTSSSSYFMGSNSMSDVLSHTQSGHRQRQSSNWSRRTFREPSKSSFDHTSLKDCLHVHQSYKVPTKSDISPREMVRLKHCPQAKVNYNNPYRKLRSRSNDGKGVSKTGGRYAFNSVESYIHFNKIYPRASELPHSNASQSHVGNGLPSIPRVNGFTSHCTDTLLLKMMFEMNKPKSGKSISKYSDVAIHKDLDEFMIVSTPTASRSESVVSRRTTVGQRAKSQVSQVTKNNDVKESAKKVVKEQAKGVNQENLNGTSQEEKPHSDGKPQGDNDDDDNDNKVENKMAEEDRTIEEEVFQEVLEVEEAKEETNNGDGTLEVDDANNVVDENKPRPQHSESANQQGNIDPEQRPVSSASEPPASKPENDDDD